MLSICRLRDFKPNIKYKLDGPGRFWSWVLRINSSVYGMCRKLNKTEKNALLCMQEGPFCWRIFPPKTPLTLEVFDRAGIIFFLWINVGSHSFLTHLFVRVIISNKWKGRSLRWNRRPLLRKITTVLLHWPQQSEQWPAGSKTIKRCMESENILATQSSQKY